MFRLMLFLFFLLLLPVGIKHVFEELSHGLLEGVVIIACNIYQLVNHLHNDVVVYSRLPVLKLIGEMCKVIILN